MKKCQTQSCPHYPALREVPYLKGNLTDVMWVSDMPSLTDSTIGSLLNGAVGDFLRSTFSSIGLRYEDIFFATASRCTIDKKAVTTKQLNETLKCCYSKLNQAITFLKPKVIVAAGELAAKQFVRAVGGVRKNRNLFTWLESYNCYLFLTLDPSFCISVPSFIEEFEYDLYTLKHFIENGFEPIVPEPIIEQIDDLRSVLPTDLKRIAIDTETQGLDWLDPNNFLISFSVCFNETHAYQIILHEWSKDVTKADFFVEASWKDGRHTVSASIPVSKHPKFSDNFETLIEILKSPSILKYMFNGQFDLCFIQQQYIKIHGKPFEFAGFGMDVQALAHLLDENLFARASLEAVRKYYTNFSNQYSIDFDRNFDKSNVIMIPQSELCKYAALDAYTTFVAGIGARAKLLAENKPLKNYFVKFLMPLLTKALPSLTLNGAKVNKEGTPLVKDELARKIKQVHDEALALIPPKVIAKHAPQASCFHPEFVLKLSRTALIRDTLYSKEGFNIKNSELTKGGVQPSVGAQTRVFLKGAKIPEAARQFINKYEEWSALNVLLTRYIKSFETVIRSDGRIHPTYSVVTTATGRSSTVSPSLQNLPKRSESSKIIRRLVVPDKRNLLLSLDYSQCLVPETELITIDGIRMLSEVIEQKLPVLSLDSNYKFEFKDVLNGWATGENEVFKVRLEDGSQVIATANHKFYDYYGNVKLLSDLKVGDRLLHARLNYYPKDYPEFTLGRKKSRLIGYRLKQRAHDCVADYLRVSGHASGRITHHKDHDKNNWARSNILLFESQSDHFKECHSVGNLNSNYGNKKGVTKECPVCGSVFYRPSSSSNQVTCSKSCGNVLFPPSQRSLRYCKKPTNNHKIISIEPYGRRLTYQIEVADNHNYILSNGLVSKNCELRWMAHLSQDKIMQEVYQDNGDIHTKTALSLLGKSLEEVTESELKTARRSAKCFHPDTEVLTKEGWVSFNNLKPDVEVMQAIPENGSIRLEWAKPAYFKLEPNHTDSMVHLKSENINLKVTPDHEMLVQRESGKFEITTIDDFLNARYFWNSGLYNTSEKLEDERILRLAVATQADGSYAFNQIRFGFTKARKVKRLLTLLISGEYTLSKHRNGNNPIVTAITLKPELTIKIKALLNADRTFSWQMLGLSLAARLIIIDELKYWDSFAHTNGQFVVYSSTKRINCDVIQALCSISGWKTKLRCRQSDVYSTGCLYELNLKNSPRSRGLNSGPLSSFTRDERLYKDAVAVITMPSGYILVRSHKGDGRQIPIIIKQCMNFGLLYGMSVNGFQRYAKVSYELDLTYDEAAHFINIFFSTYPNIRQYHKRVIAFAHKYKYVQSPFGRKRRLPGIDSWKPEEVGRCERQALNHAIQSAASDTALLALTQIMSKGLLNPDEAKPIIFVHDELVFEVAESKLDYYVPLIKTEMENPPLKELFGINMIIPLKVDAQIGYNYADLSEFKQETE